MSMARFQRTIKAAPTWSFKDSAFRSQPKTVRARLRFRDPHGRRLATPTASPANDQQLFITIGAPMRPPIVPGHVWDPITHGICHQFAIA
jgi:hypothetical protein